MRPTVSSVMRLVACPQPEELSYALGKKGMTRKKLARSSGCIVEYVGYTVFMSGTGDERKRAWKRREKARAAERRRANLSRARRAKESEGPDAK